MSNLMKKWYKDSNKWPGAVIPYEIEDDLLQDAERIAAIEGGMRHWEENTAVRFVERRASDVFYVVFRLRDLQNALCSSGVGRKSASKQPQYVTIAENRFCSEGSVIHEIGHALGLKHEHQRTDRDRFIQLLMGNMGEDGPNFKQVLDLSGMPFGAYDFRSAMHYQGTLSTHVERFSFQPAFANATFLEIGGITRFLMYRPTLSQLEFYDIDDTGAIVLEDADPFQGPRQAVIDGSGWDHLAYAINDQTDPVLIGLNGTDRRLAAWQVGEDGRPAVMPVAETVLPADDYVGFAVGGHIHNPIFCLRRPSLGALDQTLDAFRLVETAGVLAFDTVWPTFRLFRTWDAVAPGPGAVPDLLVDRSRRVVARAHVPSAVGSMDAEILYEWRAADYDGAQ